MLARAWSNGQPAKSGAGLGIAISKGDRDRYFDRSWTSVVVEFADGTPPTTARLTPSFWRTCTELRSADIGRWLIGGGWVPWPKGRPPRFDLRPVGDRRFRLEGRER